MAAKGYTTVAIPNSLANRIDRIIREGTHGYRTRGEFVVEAVRLRLEEIGRLEEAEPTPSIHPTQMPHTKPKNAENDR